MNAPNPISALSAALDQAKEALGVADALRAAGITVEQLPALAIIAREAVKLHTPQIIVQAAPVPRFEIGAETFIDHDTGLEWIANPVKFPNIDKAKELAKECRAGGHSDWRMPEDVELLTLRNSAHCEPATHPELKAITPTSDWYGTRTVYQGNKACVWVVGFGDGYVSHDFRGHSGLARFVRGGAAGPSQSL